MGAASERAGTVEYAWCVGGAVTSRSLALKGRKAREWDGVETIAQGL